MIGARLDDRALLETLESADPVATSTALARVLDPAARSLARRDAALLALHDARYGERLRCATECRGCGESLELELPVAELAPVATAESGLRLETDGFEVEYRMPTGEDVSAASSERDLAERCVTGARRMADGTPVGARALSDAAILALDAAMAERHPAGDLRIEVRCAACGAAWDAGLDLGAFVAARARAEAMGILSEVHRLATAYGWTEPDVLAIPRERRRRYLDLLSR